MISRRFGTLGVWYRSSHGLQPGCELLAELTAAGPGSPGGAGTKANAEDDRSVRIDIKGRLAALCGNPALFPNMAMSGGSLVAGEGLEPPTPGLLFPKLKPRQARPWNAPWIVR